VIQPALNDSRTHFQPAAATAGLLKVDLSIFFYLLPETAPAASKVDIFCLVHYI